MLEWAACHLGLNMLSCPVRLSRISLARFDLISIFVYNNIVNVNRFLMFAVVTVKISPRYHYQYFLMNHLPPSWGL